VKKCISCHKDIPETAVHCVFCGAKQGQVATAQPNQKTIMGFAASDLDLLKQQVPGGQQQPPQQAQQPYNPAPQNFSAPPGAPRPASGNPAAAATMFASGPAPGPQAPAQQAPQHAPTMMVMGGPPGMGGAPMGGSPMPPPASAPTMMVAGLGHGPGPSPMGPQMGPPMGPPMGPAMGPSMGGNMGPGGSMGSGPPQMQIASPHVLQQQQQPQYRPQPQMPARPQYLASETAGRAMNPVEPWADSLKTLMIIFGAFLALTFVIPWGIGGGRMIFSWNMLDSGRVTAMAWPFILLGAGVAALIVGLIGSTTARGLTAALIGVGALVAMKVIGSPMSQHSGPDKDWQGYVLLLGLLTTATGLLVRSQYRQAILGRILATVGAVMLLAFLLVPTHSQVPLVAAIKMLTNAPVRAMALVSAGSTILLFIGALLALLAWLPAPSTAGGTGIAWLHILWSGVVGLLVVILVVHDGDFGALLKSPITIMMPVSLVAFYALGAYGMATIFGKNLESN
jgi:hypothetical protein